jgi:hypothetical protein
MWVPLLGEERQEAVPNLVGTVVTAEPSTPLWENTPALQQASAILLKGLLGS